MEKITYIHGICDVRNFVNDGSLVSHRLGDLLLLNCQFIELLDVRISDNSVVNAQLLGEGVESYER